MQHRWEVVKERKEIEGVEFMVGDWVEFVSDKSSYGYIKDYTINRDRNREYIVDVSYSVQMVRLHGHPLKNGGYALNKSESELLKMNDSLSIPELKFLIDIALDEKDKDYFLEVSSKLKEQRALHSK